MKQTAVEWLVKHLSERGYIQAPSFGHSIIDKAIEQAREMEKEQIMTAFTQGDIFGADYFDGVNITEENYYNQTFNNESNT
jgi:hypothetical protein